MTADEIKSKIGFRQYDTGKYFVVVANIFFSAEQRVLSGTDGKSAAIDCVKENLRELILRNIFDDQRKEMCEAMDEFLQWSDPHHGNFEKFFAARDRLMKAANYQPAK